MSLNIYVTIAPIVATIGLFILLKIEPMDRPFDFEEFMMNTLMGFMMWVMMGLAWPLTIIFGGLYVIYQYKYEDAFRAGKARDV